MGILTPASDKAHNPPWLFGVLSIPYGTANAVITILLPYVLRKHGVAVEQIASVIAIASIPSVWFFAYSPVVDMGLQRRTWVCLAAVSTGILSAIAILRSGSSLQLLTTLLFMSSALAGLLSTSMGALLSTLPAESRGRASGWYQAGNLGGGAIGGGVGIWLADKISTPLLSLAVAALIVAPLAAITILREHHRPPSNAGQFVGARFKSLVRDFVNTAKSRRTLTGLVFLLSPVGSAAVANLISGIGQDYRASATEVALVSGIAGGLLSAFGSVVGGYVCDRIDVMKGYALAGLLCGAFAIYMGFGPHNPWTYGIGYAGYAIAAGFAYAVFTALVLEILGPTRQAVGTSYSLLVASGNLPIIYMTWMDGLGYQHWQLRGLMGIDALGNCVIGVALLFFAGFARRVWARSPESIA
jgi:MFS transporter, PAT family, beta-lactamase induction signal transducer AmpG